MNRETNMPLEELLDTILQEESTPSHEALSRWSKRFPEHRDALASFFATWAVQEESPKTAFIEEDRITQNLVSHALHLLHKRVSVQAAAAAAAPRLFDAIAMCGKSEEEVASRCGLDDSILAKLDRRLIRLASIPRVCLERLAAAIDWSIDQVRATLAGPPIPVASHKATERPEVRVEDFIDAVRASDLPDEAKADWSKRRYR